MLISCPECETSFTVPANALGEKGRKVKCSKCSHVWHQNPVEFKKEKLDDLLKSGDNMVSSSNETQNLPVKVSKKLVYSLSGTLVFTFILAATFFYLNMESTILSYKGLRFSNFSVQSEIIDNRYDFSLDGQLINITDKEKSVPKVNIKILSKGGRVMAEASIEPEVKVIAPYSRVTFSPEITQVSGNADRVELSLANWAERIFE